MRARNIILFSTIFTWIIWNHELKLRHCPSTSWQRFRDILYPDKTSISVSGLQLCFFFRKCRSHDKSILGKSAGVGNTFSMKHRVSKFENNIETRIRSFLIRKDHCKNDKKSVLSCYFKNEIKAGNFERKRTVTSETIVDRHKTKTSLKICFQSNFIIPAP